MMKIATVTINEPGRETEIDVSEVDVRVVTNFAEYLDRYYPRWTSAVVVVTNRGQHIHDWKPAGGYGLIDRCTICGEERA